MAALVERLIEAHRWAVAENDHVEPELCAEAATEITRLQSEIDAKGKRAVETAKDVLASLVAAISILKRASDNKQSPKMVVASDAMFMQMLKDYDASVIRARSIITEIGAGK